MHFFIEDPYAIDEIKEMSFDDLIALNNRYLKYYIKDFLPSSSSIIDYLNTLQEQELPHHVHLLLLCPRPNFQDTDNKDKIIDSLINILIKTENAIIFPTKIFNITHYLASDITKRMIVRISNKGNKIKKIKLIFLLLICSEFSLD